MASPAARKRLAKEFQTMQKSPPPFCWATPEEKNILNWHFILRGPPDSVYEGGEYHGLIMFPGDYPFKPPDIKLFTPSGRFKPETKICTSMTSFHPSTWNPAWSVATILTGLLSFMLSEEITTGSMTASSGDRKALAEKSHAFNIGNKKFRDIFPEYAGKEMRPVPDMFTSPPKASTTSQAAPSSVSHPSSSSHPPPSTASSSLSSSHPSPPSPLFASTADSLVDPKTGMFNLNIASLPSSSEEADVIPLAPASSTAATPKPVGLQEGKRGGLGSVSWIAVVLVAVIVGIGKLGSSRWA